MMASVFLAIVAIAGHACALAIIDVQPFAVYQHYPPWSALLSQRPAALWGLLAQTIIVAAVAWRNRARLRAALPRAFSPGRLLLLAMLVAFSLAVPSLSAWRFAGELAISGAVAGIAALNLILVGLVLPDDRLARLVAWVDIRVTLHSGDPRLRTWDRQVPLVAAACSVVLGAMASYIVMERVPHIDDSISYYFQAKYHAAGYLFLPPPPDGPSFHVDEVIIEPTKWYGYGLPGWPALLAVGVLAGMPWAVNPLLGGALVLLAHKLLLRRYDRATANATVMLLACSPWLIFMSAELMPHPLTAALVLLAAMAFDHASERQPGWPARAALAGLAIGWIALTRAFEAPLAAAAIGLTTAIDGRLRRALPAAAVAGIVVAAVAALVLPYNLALTGDATYTPQMAWTDRRWGVGVDRLGFGSGIGIPEWRQIDPLPGHGAADVVLNANKNAFMANVELFGWASGSLILAYLTLAVGPWRRSDGLCLAIVGVFVLGYSFWWFSGGPDLGPRYWYPLLVPLAALSVRGACLLAESVSLSNAGARVGAMIAVASLSASATMIPWRAATKHYRYREIGGQVRELAAKRGFGRDLIFVRSAARSDYQAAFNLNPPTLDSPRAIYAYDAGPEHRAAVVSHFPDHRVWVIGRQAPGRFSDFDVLSGPLAPGTVPQ